MAYIRIKSFRGQPATSGYWPFNAFRMNPGDIVEVPDEELEPHLALDIVEIVPASQVDESRIISREDSEEEIARIRAEAAQAGFGEGSQKKAEKE